jgi:hypothetical protein
LASPRGQVYTPAGQKMQIYKYYGPYGTSGTYPAWTAVEGTCDWMETKTTVLKKISLATHADGSGAPCACCSLLHLASIACSATAGGGSPSTSVLQSGPEQQLFNSCH